jgi:LysM repeat protein
MSGHPPIAATIEAYRKKRQKKTPVIIGVIAILLVVVGVIVLVVEFSQGGGLQLFATETPTPTITPSPTSTPLPTETPTVTSTPTETLTPTPAAIYSYVVQEGDYLGKIIQDHGLSDNDLLIILILNPYRGAALENSIDPIAQIVYVGQKITLPPPGMTLPTATPIPANAPRGTKISYFVLPGDSLGGIANKFNSTVDEIVKANKELLPDGAATIIYPGWTLIVPVNMVPPVPTSTPTMTSTP